MSATQFPGSSDKTSSSLDNLDNAIAFCAIGSMAGILVGVLYHHYHAVFNAITSALSRMDFSMVLPMMALFFLCNYWVTHPVVPCKQGRPVRK